MKLQNKKTGVFGRLKRINEEDGKTWFEVETKKYVLFYYSLAELNEEWEDYKEPKQQYYIKANGDIGTCGAIEDDMPDEMLSKMEEIGNKFETKEEIEKAVEKLKAWTRLKDKGARFKGWFWDKNYGTCIIIGDSECDYIDDGDDQNKKDLDLLFGGEE